MAGHRRHQGPAPLPPGLGQGAPHGRRRRRGHRRDPRPGQGRGRAGRRRLRAAPSRDRHRGGDDRRGAAGARRPRHQHLLHVGLRAGQLAGAAPQLGQAVLRRPQPGEDQGALSPPPAHPQRDGAPLRGGRAQRAPGRVHAVHRIADPPRRPDGVRHHLRHPRGQAARGRPRRGRRLRQQARGLPGGGPGPGPLAQDRQADQVDRGALRGLPGHSARARHHPGDGAGGHARRHPEGRALPRAGLHGRLLRPGLGRHPDARRVALRRGLRPRGLRLRVHQRVHQQHVHRRLPRRRPAGGHLRHRAVDGRAGPQAGHGPGRAAQEELHQDGELPQLHDRQRPDRRLGRLQRHVRQAAREPRLREVPPGPGRPGGPRGAPR